MAETNTRPSLLDKFSAKINAKWQNNTITQGLINRTLDDVSCDEFIVENIQLAASGSKDYNITDGAKLILIAIANGSSSTSATIELDDSGQAVAFDNIFFSSGTAGAEDIDIANADGANALDLIVVIGY